MGKRSRIVHVEWRSKNVERLKQFYKNAFKWKFAEPMPGYSTADTGNKGIGGGFMQIEGNTQVTPGIVSFLEAEDLASTEAAIREAGGHVITSAQPVEGMGRFSIFSDPDGNQLAIWQSESDIKKAEKRAAKQAKKAETFRADAERADEKARKKAEKKAAKKAKKADKKAKTSAEPSAKADGQKDKTKDKKKDKKKKDKKRSQGGLEAGAV